MSRLTQSPAWQALQAQAQRLQSVSTGELFAREPLRARLFSAEACGLYLDYSKQRLDAEALGALLGLAQQQELPQWRERLFAGEAVNHTEQRAAWHVALRAPRGQSAYAVSAEVEAVRSAMYRFAGAVRSGERRGAGGARISDVVNIGIGGSDFGPRMVCDALAPLIDGPQPHFVANVDGAELHALLARLRPESTLFVVTSKTFTTQETLANAQQARAWLVAALGEAAVARHFVAVSTQVEAVRAFGIDSADMFGFWEWVGGRYSLWSAVGLSIVLALGPERFDALCAGAHAMDRHFADAAPERNLPLLLGLLGVWNTNFLGCASQLVVPYAQRLSLFCGWAQQLEMESNGKRVDRSGAAVDYATTPALWGSIGTNAQHAYFQMLHQGPAVHAVDFILPVEPQHLWRNVDDRDIRAGTGIEHRLPATAGSQRPRPLQGPCDDVQPGRLRLPRIDRRHHLAIVDRHQNPHRRCNVVDAHRLQIRHLVPPGGRRHRIPPFVAVTVVEKDRLAAELRFVADPVEHVIEIE